MTSSRAQDGSKELQVAFVHEWLNSYGGAERVLESMLEIYPDAPIYTLVYEPGALSHSPISDADVRPSFIDRLPWARSKHRSYFPLMPFAVEQLDLREFDVIISFSHSLSHGVLARPDQLHINYVYTPARFAWHQYHQYINVGGPEWGLKGAMVRLILHYFRVWDQAASKRVDRFIAISNWIADAIWRAYRRKAEVIHPPVDVEHFRPLESLEDYYITVSRLVPNKHIDLIARACLDTGARLLVVGEGPEKKRLSRLATDGVEILGWQSDTELYQLMGRARAFVHAAEEDFGIAPLEAMAAGRPVIAYRSGALVEVVSEGENGVFFDDQSVEGLKVGLREFERRESSFDPSVIRKSALRFSKDRFKSSMQALIQQAWGDYRRDRSV